MKNQIFLIIMAFSFITCQPDKIVELELELTKVKQEQKQKELERMEQEIAQREKDVADLESNPKVEQNATPKVKTQPETTYSSRNNGTCTGSGVNMRKDPSISSSIVNQLNKNERLEVLEMTTSYKRNEAITTQPIALYNSYGKKVNTLVSGKAVKVVEYLGDNQYLITYEHVNLGTLKAEVSGYTLEFISGEDWTKVRKSTGHTGWVLSRFIRED